ncbi:uncharacterized protein KGF55_005359 [Candida pseudojiufengensis]|uniref:uncharacterized protein n=1 Tax=Candida pseudojiufengensis TaxID=497109 RepID=UPI0022252872|nr:uncharacterized protein KGF55_005359 [Candida pseudojiufengensis]KAI5959382.1 hypothetical protein KGF55_005359 [Candida pseudojiufengensis]
MMTTRIKFKQRIIVLTINRKPNIYDYKIYLNYESNKSKTIGQWNEIKILKEIELNQDFQFSKNEFNIFPSDQFFKETISLLKLTTSTTINKKLVDLNLDQSFKIGVSIKIISNALVWVEKYFANSNKRVRLKYISVRYFKKNLDDAVVDKEFDPEKLVDEFIARFKSEDHAAQVCDKIKELKQGSMDLDKFNSKFFEKASLLSDEDLKEKRVQIRLVETSKANING